VDVCPPLFTFFLLVANGPSSLSPPVYLLVCVLDRLSSYLHLQLQLGDNNRYAASGLMTAGDEKRKV